VGAGVAGEGLVSWCPRRRRPFNAARSGTLWRRCTLPARVTPRTPGVRAPERPLLEITV